MKTLTRAEVMEMSPGDLVVELAKRGVKLAETDGMIRGKATCPHCGKEGTIAKDFGVRIMRGQLWPQSWCRDCRAGKSAKPSKGKQATRSAAQGRKLHLIKPHRNVKSRRHAEAKSLGNF